jgi:hypothetical protein
MLGLVKIGFTTRTAQARAAELSAASGVPEPFIVEYSRDDDAPATLEFGIHESLGVHRLNADREFFEVSVEYAIQTIERVATSEMHWRRAFYSILNRAPQDWRERALETIDRPVFDTP